MAPIEEEKLVKEHFAERYTDISLRGQGGMGTVYSAYDGELERQVAIKVLLPEHAANPQMVKRFRREAQNIASMNHQNVVHIYDVSPPSSELCYFVMAFIPGGTLTEQIQPNGLPEEKIAKWGIEVCSALEHAHARGLVHRDLKSDNIMLDEEGRAVVVDFGIARANENTRLTQIGTIFGTPEYMSPEQVLGRDLDERSDIYSLGIILYYMATGSVPFEGESPLVVAYKQQNEPPDSPVMRNPSVPEWLSKIILRCIAKSPDGRFQSAADLKDALIKKTAPDSIRTRTRVLASLFFLTLLVAGTSIILWHFYKPYLYANAQRLFKQEQFKAAAWKFEWLLAFDPDYPGAKEFLFLSYCKLGEKLYQAKEYETAVDAFRKSIKIRPDSSTVYYYLGTSLAELSNWKQAVDAYESAVRIDSTYVEAYMGLGTVYSAQKDIMRSIEAYKKALKHTPVEPTTAASLYCKLGEKLYQVKEYETAVDAFRKSIKIRPDSSAVYYYLGTSLAQLSNWKQAVDAYESAVRIDSTYVEAYMGLGTVYEAQKDTMRSIEAFENALKHTPVEPTSGQKTMIANAKKRIKLLKRPPQIPY